LLERLEKPGDCTPARSITDLYRVFPNETKMTAAVCTSEPLGAVLLRGHIFLLYRPTADNKEDCGLVNSGSESTRSTIWLAPMELVDNEGKEIGSCWFAPLTFAIGKPHITGFGSLVDLDRQVELRLLLLPLVSDNTDGTFINQYYVIADNWSERQKSGVFTTYSLDSTLFIDWQEQLTTINNE
jgi:hypothetical protein